MLSMDQFRTLAGRTLKGRDGDKIGKIDQLYADSEGGTPTFVTVETGLFGSDTTFVPVAEGRVDGDDLTVPYTKDQVKDAPSISPDGELSEAEEDRLYAHYGLADGSATTTAGTGAATGTGTGTQATGEREPVGHDTSGPTTDSAMTRSEERLRVGKEQVETGRARLRKYVVTEEVTQTVPVSREEVRLERVPVTDEDRGAATDGPAISEEEHEVVLTEERPVVAKETVPVERVRLGTETVTEEREVGDSVRKEQIDLDAGSEADARR